MLGYKYDINNLCSTYTSMNNKTFNLVITHTHEYVYLIQPRHIEQKNLNVFKIGRTAHLHNRFKQYPPNSTIYKVIRVQNCYSSET